MKLALALALCLAASASAQAPAPTPAQTPQFTDPANLRGERPTPRTGRELPIDLGASGLQQALRKLSTRGSVLNIVAHPDDEDGGMLTVYSRGLGARVADLSLTRGEGGQNAMTGDFEDALGLLRTQELLSNDRYVGVTQMFGTEVDFGFSKTKEEAFAKWTHERVLYDAVRAIRLFRPLVITATFVGGVTDGHGQHQVSGQIAQEAFKAAADPTIFPDMVAEGILPWQAAKVFARVPFQSISSKGLYDYATGQYAPAQFTNYYTGEVTTTVPSSDVIVHEGATDPLLNTCSADLQDLSDAPAALTSHSSQMTGPQSVVYGCRLSSYVQFARIGLGLQKSQIGPGVREAPSGAFDIAYHLYGSTVCPPESARTVCHPERSAHGKPPVPPDPNATFFTGIDTSLAGIANLLYDSTFNEFKERLQADLETISRHITEAQTAFTPTHPDLCATPLSAALSILDPLIKDVEKQPNIPNEQRQNLLHELRIKRVQLNDAIVLSLGLTFDADATTAGHGDSILYDPLDVHTHLAAGAAHHFGEVHQYLRNAQNTWSTNRADNQSPIAIPGPLALNTTLEFADSKSTEVRRAPAATLTRPYFQRQSIEQPFYDLNDRVFRNAPSSPPALTAWAAVPFNGLEITIGHVVRDGVQPISFVSKFNVALSTHAQVLPLSSNHVDISASNHSLYNARIAVGVCPPKDCAPDNWKPGLTPNEGSFRVQLAGPPPTAPFNISAFVAVTTDSGSYIEKDVTGYRPVGYGDLPRTNYYTPAATRIVPVDLKLPTRHNIAYLPGTGDAVPEALASIGLAPTILTVADLTTANLKQYDTVILGVRTYNAHPDLHGGPTQSLLDYSRNGGNVVVQYQSAEFTAADAPYPLSLPSNEKVVDETAAVQLTVPKAPLFAQPNLITSSDFNNWVEERGHGFLSTWDTHYTALTETHDPNQAPQRGGLITTELGKGRWTYTSFALYRQLPEAVPGAFRLFVNLLNP